MADTINMSLDEIIKKNNQNRASRSRGRGGATTRGRGGRGAVGGGQVGRGGRGGGGRGRGRGRGRGGNNSRSGTPGSRNSRSRSRSRGPQTRGRSQSRAMSQSRTRSQSRARSRSRINFRSNSRARSASRTRRGLTPRGRAGLEDHQPNIPNLIRNNRFQRGVRQNGLRRSNSNPNLSKGVHSRLGVNTRRGRPLAVAKRGIAKQNRGLSTNRYSAIGLRSDQILKEQRIKQNNIIRSQTFTRSRNNSFNSNSHLTISVANDFAKRRRNSFGNAGFLSKQALSQLNEQFGGYNTRRGPGSVKSMGSNKSGRSNYSNRSNRSRGRGGNRGVGRKFVNKQILNPRLQKEIAALQGKSSAGSAADPPSGVSFAPTPTATAQTLHERFART